MKKTKLNEAMTYGGEADISHMAEFNCEGNARSNPAHVSEIAASPSAPRNDGGGGQASGWHGNDRKLCSFRFQISALALALILFMSFSIAEAARNPNFDAASIGATSEYNSYNRRDPFVPLVGVSTKNTRKGVAGVLTIEDVELKGIFVNPNGIRKVIINDEIMDEGDKIARVYIEKINDDTVQIKIDDESYILKLYE